LTNVFAVIPLSVLFAILSQFGVIPVLIALKAIYGRDHLSESGSLIGTSALISGFWESLALITSFVLVYVFLWLWLRFFEKRQFWTLGYETKNALIKYGRGFLLGAAMFAAQLESSRPRVESPLNKVTQLNKV